MSAKRLAVIGASYLQRPLVEEARKMGCEVYVFAWSEGNVVSDLATEFYSISITEKEAILEKCKEIGIDGIISIASDLAIPTVNYVAHHLGLTGNTMEATSVSTDKYLMRQRLRANKLPCPDFMLVKPKVPADFSVLRFPVIVKPVDRSGSRGVTKIMNQEDVPEAVRHAQEGSFSGEVIVEEFIAGREVSVEFISFNGNHHPLAITDKVTSGEPHFVELEHHQPARLSDELKKGILEVTQQSLTALGIANGASHTEILITDTNELYLVEVAGRMGGDFIGSDLVWLSTGFEYVREVIRIALGMKPNLNYQSDQKCAGIHFYTSERPQVATAVKEKPEFMIKGECFEDFNKTQMISNSAERGGYLIYRSSKRIRYSDLS